MLVGIFANGCKKPILRVVISWHSSVDSMSVGTPPGDLLAIASRCAGSVAAGRRGTCGCH